MEYKMTQTVHKNRIEWVDVLRGIAIIFVLLAHYDAASAGRLYHFAHKFSVALFFFISGMMSLSAQKNDLVQYAKKQAGRLLLPYAFFAVVNSLFFFVFNRSIGVKGIADMLITYIIGKRNTLATAPMWFLPCLFIVCLLYKALWDTFKSHKAVLPICFVLSAAAKIFFEEPIMVWSFNHGIKYLIYYAIGAAVFPVIKNFDFSSVKNLAVWQKALLAIAVAADLWYVCCIYLGKNIIPTPNLVSACAAVFINAMAIIIFMTLLSMTISHFKPLSVIGRETLGFCCGESISRALLNTAMALTGFGFAANSPLKVVVYNFIAMAISYFVIILPLNLFFPQLLGKPKRTKKEKISQ